MYQWQQIEDNETCEVSQCEIRQASHDIAKASTPNYVSILARQNMGRLHNDHSTVQEPSAMPSLLKEDTHQFAQFHDRFLTCVLNNSLFFFSFRLLWCTSRSGNNSGKKGKHMTDAPTYISCCICLNINFFYAGPSRQLGPTLKADNLGRGHVLFMWPYSAQF